MQQKKEKNIFLQIFKKMRYSFQEYCICYRPRMEFNNVKISNKQFKTIKRSIDNYCNEVANEIATYKNNNSVSISYGTNPLPSYEIVSKLGDYLGPVILVNGEYYRCIKKESISKFCELWESGIIQIFMEKGFIPKVTISGFFTNEWPIILKQETIPIKKIEELSIFESKKCLFFVSVLQEICKKMGCVLLDPHFYNYTIVDNKVLYYDLGSFYMTHDLDSHTDFSMIVLGAYRILFSFFPDSVLSKQELGAFRTDTKQFEYQVNLHEFFFFRKRGLKHIKNHCSKIVLNAYRNIFYLHQCKPWDVLICFLPEYTDNYLSLLD